MGSKSRIAKFIVPVIQEYINKNNIQCYVEPFVGGANVIDKITCEKRIGIDLNKYLIALLKHVQEGKPLLDEVPRELYNKARESFNNGDTSNFEDWEIGCIGFLASYNGRFFDGGFAKSGFEKTKYGLRLRDYYKESKNNLLNQGSSLKGINFMVGDYKEMYGYHNCLIYCDPPYQNTKQYSNAAYFDYKCFWETVREWSKDNVVLISEQAAPDDFECIWEQKVSRSIKASDKSKSTEKLFIKQ